MIDLPTITTHLRAESRMSHDFTRHALLYAAVTALDALAMYENTNGSDRLFRGTLPVTEKADAKSAVNTIRALTYTHKERA